MKKIFFSWFRQIWIKKHFEYRFVSNPMYMIYSYGVTIDSRREKGLETPHWIERSSLVTVT